MHIQKYIPAIFCTLLFLLPATVSAATISLLVTPKNVGVGDTVRVDILLNSTIPTNAFSGSVSYSKGTLEPIAVSDGSSIINVWITHPAILTKDAAITFAGITPGGFSGGGGNLFSILFRAKAIGSADVSLGDVEVLRNDGTGGKEPVTIKQLTFLIGSKSSGGYTESDDTTPPESFTAYVARDAQLFGGKSYLAFMAVDKLSGIDHYAVAESRMPSLLLPLSPLSWTPLPTGPYVLSDQNLTSTIYLKAVDRVGNERLNVYPPTHLLTGYEEVVLLAILIGVVLLWWRGWGRRFKKNL